MVSIAEFESEVQTCRNPSMMTYTNIEKSQTNHVFESIPRIPGTNFYTPQGAQLWKLFKSTPGVLGFGRLPPEPQGYQKITPARLIHT